MVHSLIRLELNVEVSSNLHNNFPVACEAIIRKRNSHRILKTPTSVLPQWNLPTSMCKSYFRHIECTYFVLLVTLGIEPRLILLFENWTDFVLLFLFYILNSYYEWYREVIYTTWTHEGKKKKEIMLFFGIINWLSMVK